MSNFISRTNQSFLSLCKEIDQEIFDVSRNIQNLSDEELTERRYADLTAHLNHIQNLFDRASVAIKGLTLDQSNPQLYEILEQKNGLNEKYGVFNRTRSSFVARYERLHENDSAMFTERDIGERSEPSEVGEEEELDETTDEISEDSALEEDFEEEFLEEEEDPKKKAKKPRSSDDSYYKQQQREYAEQQNRAEQTYRQEIADHQSMPTNPHRPISEADLRTERLRQEDERIRAEDLARERRSREEAMYAEYQRRMQNAENFQGVGKGHLDYSKNLDYNGSGPAFTSYDATPAGFSPTGTIPLYATSFNPADPQYTNTSNKEIISRLSASDYQEGKPTTVASAYEQQMRFNVESARMEYHAVRGTAEEQAAAHKYLQERSAYAEFQRAVKNNRFAIEEAPHPTEPTRSVKAPDSVASQSPFLSFTPSGVEGCSVENGKLGKSTLMYNNPGLTVNVRFTPESPMTVSPEYEAQLFTRMKTATGAMNAILEKQNGVAPGSLPHAVSAELKLATEAYLGFKSAKAAGTVVVSAESGNKTPDFRMWQQQYGAKTNNINISQALGTTGHNLGVNLNKISKASVEEVSSSPFKHESSLKRQSVAGTYFNIVGDRFQAYSAAAAMQFSRKVFQLIQSGDDNGLSALDNGRYYATTAYHVGRAIANAHPVASAAHSAAKLASWEFQRFGNLTSLDKAALAKQIVEHDHSARALKNQIKSLTEKGAALTKEQREQLSQLRKEHHQVNSQLRREMTYAKYRQSNELTLKVAQELKEKHAGIVTIKHVDDELQRVYKLRQEDLKKKFGNLATATDKSVARKIRELDRQNPLLKAQIQKLQAKGSALTAAERVQLKALMDKHKENSLLLRKLKGLSKVKGQWDDQIGALNKLRKQMAQNSNAWSGGFYAIQNLMLKPIFEGSETGALGLAKGIRFVTNPYVRKLMAKAARASFRVATAGVDLVAPGTSQAVRTTVDAAKTLAKAQITSAQYQVKTAVSSANRQIKTAVKQTASKYTPPKVKTAVKKGTAAAEKANAGLRAAAAKAKQRFASSKLGQALAKVKTAFTNASAALSKALAALKALGMKALAAFVVIFLAVGIFSAIVTSFIGGSSATTIIMSPYTSDDGKISLEPYVKILKEKQVEWEAEIEALETEGEYDNVITKYGTSTQYNYKEILCMMAIKLDQDLELSGPRRAADRVENCLSHLFDVSHSYSTTESYWECSPGCKTRLITETIYCETGDGICYENPEVPCRGHVIEVEEAYCSGHMDLYVTKNVLDLENLFYADENGFPIWGDSGSFDGTLGGVSAKYEAGGINPGRISSGAGDYGGKSYGTWQLSSKMGSLKSFMNWLKSGADSSSGAEKIYDALKGHELASSGFDSAWQAVAIEYHDEFQELQARYIYKSYVAPFIKTAKEKLGVDLSRSKALTELAFSTSVQFGAGGTYALGDIDSSMTDKEIIETCYANKRDNVSEYFSNCSKAIQKSLKNNRFVTEEKDLLSLIGAETTPSDKENTEDSYLYWNDDRKAMVYLLYNTDWAELYDVYFSSASGKQSTPMEEKNIEEIIAACKAECPDLSPAREKSIRTALSLVGKVQYYWGGGHESNLKAGWNDKWGTPAPASSSSTTTYTTWGLDCSGFIRWAFLTSFNVDVYPYTAQGIRDANTAISAAEAKPGDLANVPGHNGGSDVHIGMYLYTRADGERVFVHCGSSSGVSLTTEYQAGFELYHRSPLL